MPRVSVILPNYNYARYLEECAGSALNQTMRDLELLYVDDGSSDASNAVMQTYADDPRVSLRCHRENSGHIYLRWNERGPGCAGRMALVSRRGRRRPPPVS